MEEGEGMEWQLLAEKKYLVEFFPSLEGIWFGQIRLDLSDLEFPPLLSGFNWTLQLKILRFKDICFKSSLT